MNLTCSIGNYKFRGEIVILLLLMISLIAFFTLYPCATCTVVNKEGFAKSKGYYSTTLSSAADSGPGYA